VHAIHGRQYDIIPRALLALPSLRRRRFDIIMTHTWTGHAAAARLLGSALDLPVVLRLRGDTWSATEDLVRLYDTLPRRIGMWCRMTLGSRNVRDLDCVMPVAHWMTRLGQERVPDSRALWLPVHYPVREMPPPPEDTGRLLRRWSPEGRPIVASVTNFGYWNKINPMLEAAPAMAEFLERHGMLWVIAGTGAMYEDSFFERLADLCPPHLWHRAGFTSEPWLLYYSAWAFLHLSNEEGLPAVVMEAQSCGCPVVTNRHPGMSELVQHERTGLSVEEPGDAAGMLERLAGEEGLRESLRERAREWISTTHSREAVGRQMAEVLARVRAHYHETGRGSDRSGGRR
jgi:glycosyltransferase involved in cell wall biosynthesis